MDVCMVTKFPPIQGGIAARSYWLACALAESGVRITVVTNACSVEDEYRIHGCDEHLATLANVKILSTSPDVPWHIPMSSAYCERLLALVLDHIDTQDCQLMDAGFLVPYGVVAFMAHRLTGVPYVLRHGGSDIAKFLTNTEFRPLLERVIKGAALVITDREHVDVLRPLNSRLVVTAAYVPDPRYFHPALSTDRPVPVVGYFGKVNYYWTHKRLSELAKQVDSTLADYRLVLVAQGIGLSRFRESLPKRVLNRAEFRPFIPPWEMPVALNSVDYVMVARDEAIRSPSNVEAEAVACGKRLIMLRERDPVTGQSPDGGTAFTEWIEANLSAYGLAASLGA